MKCEECISEGNVGWKSRDHRSVQRSGVHSHRTIPRIMINLWETMKGVNTSFGALTSVFYDFSAVTIIILLCIPIPGSPSLNLIWNGKEVSSWQLRAEIWISEDIFLSHSCLKDCLGCRKLIHPRSPPSGGARIQWLINAGMQRPGHLSLTQGNSEDPFCLRSFSWIDGVC